MRQKDIRATALYQEAEAFYREVRQPGTGQISDASELMMHPRASHAAFTGSLVDKLEGSPQTRICQIEISTRTIQVLTFGPHTDRLPKYSPDGATIAFLSDRAKAGDFQLYLLDLQSGAARAAPTVEGWVEYLHWSPDGERILLGVAGHGADLSGAQGATTSSLASSEPTQPWMPSIEVGDEECRWRHAWIYEIKTGRVHRVSHAGLNLWEAVWLNNSALAAVISPKPEEGAWYEAHLAIIDIETGASRELYKPRDQLGVPAASPSGRYLTVIEAVCSDRWFVAGDLKFVDLHSGAVRRIDTNGVDIVHAEWRSDQQLLLAGHRGFETVVGLYDAQTAQFRETWKSDELTGAGRYISISGISDNGDCAFVAESFLTAPTIGLIQGGKFQPLKSFDIGYSAELAALHSIRRITWKARDGIEIQGWLLLPNAPGPHPLLMNIHGGPVWHWRPFFMGRGGAFIVMLLRRGHAIFLPNPRGSSGRGRDYASRVVGDMGGADAYDLLSGIDHLVATGVADRGKLSVTGGSYGGFMSSWLITQDSRFAAAIPVAPATNHVTAYLTSNIPHFVSLFLQDTLSNPQGKYFERSPVMHAHKARTPTLNICGALDRCTPPTEASQFHNALVLNDVKSMLVTYPQEGHGVRNWPASIDYAARITAWLEAHL